MTKKQKSVASVDTTGAVVVGVSSVIRWDDVMTINGHEVKVSKAVLLGVKKDLNIARMLRRDLKSKTGLLITFPMAMLMNQLQEKIGTGREVLDQVKP
jgi:hypothetical protein